MIRFDEKPDNLPDPYMLEPLGPDAKETGEARTLTAPINELECRTAEAAQGADHRGRTRPSRWRRS
jgi:hypothetical protein